MLASSTLTRIAYIIFALLGLSGLIVWFSQQSIQQSNNVEIDENSRDESYIAMENIRLTRYDDAGHINMLATAKTAHQATKGAEMELTEVEITSYAYEQGQDVKLATIESAYGLHNPVTGNMIVCHILSDCYDTEKEIFTELALESAKGNAALEARVRSLAETNQMKPAEALGEHNVQLIDYSTTPVTLVKSSVLIYDTQARIITNQRPTALQKGNNLLTGIGLIADLTAHRYKLQRDITTKIISDDIVPQIKNQTTSQDSGDAS